MPLSLKGQRFRIGDADYELVEPFGVHRWRCRLTNKNMRGTVCLRNLTILQQLSPLQGSRMEFPLSLVRQSMRTLRSYLASQSDRSVFSSESAKHVVRVVGSRKE
jgi:hypothetical protein